MLASFSSSILPRRPSGGSAARSQLARLLTRKLWLPRPVHAILPLVYLILCGYAVATGWALGAPGNQPLHSAMAACIAAITLQAALRNFWRARPHHS